MPQRETGKPGYQEAHTLLIVDDDEINRGGFWIKFLPRITTWKKRKMGKLGFKKSWITPKNTERCFWMWSCPR